MDSWTLTADWPYRICICRSFPFSRNIYNLLRFTLVNLLVSNHYLTPKEHVFAHFSLNMASIVAHLGCQSLWKYVVCVL